LNNVALRSIPENKTRKKALAVGDIVLEKSGGTDNAPVGRVMFCDERISKSTYLCNNFTLAMRVNPELALPRYLFLQLHYLHGIGVTRLMQNKTTGIHNLRINEYMSMNIPIPPLDIQRQIAAVLDKAQAVIAARCEQIAVLDKLAKDVFVDMFGDPVKNEKGWEIKPLTEFYKNGKQAVKCGPFGSALKKEEYTEKGIAVWTMDNITKLGEFIDEPYLYITPTKYKQLESYKAENGDVLISRAGTVGKMCVVDSVETDAIISTNLIRTRFNEKLLLPQYFVSLILCYGARVARLKRGADNAFTHMNTGILDSICFPYPPITLQHEYIYRFHTINAQKSRLATSLAELEALYQSLTKRAFAGELF
jgi:type I restriction enzyme S subunit